MKYKRAFTLAEVLITLSIIGVVAALTIPSIIINNKKEETVTSFKKIYSVLNNALYLAQVEYGSSKEWDLNDSSVWPAYFLNYLNVVKDCGTRINEGCFAKGVMYKYLNGKSETIIDNTAHYKIILNDGISVYFFMGATMGMGLIDVDLNGSKGPNARGKDVFEFHFYPNASIIVPHGIYRVANVTKDKLIPRSIEEINASCDKSNTAQAGWYCGAKILLDGYKINYW